MLPTCLKNLMTSPTDLQLKFVPGSRGNVAVYNGYQHIGDIHQDSFSAISHVFLDELKEIVEYIEKNDPNR